MAYQPVRARAPHTLERSPLVSLDIGCVLTATQPRRVRTILGSCVTVILHVPRLRISSLCHAQSPEPRFEGQCVESCPRPCREQGAVTSKYRYVTCCLGAMLEDLSRLGARKNEMVATVVGGANVVREIKPSHSVASENVCVALSILEREGIRILRTDVGGQRGRTIVHHTDSNQLDIKLHSSER